MIKFKTFSEYVESKERLLQSVNNVPKVKILYEVLKYCTVPYEDHKGNKEYLKLKPYDVLEIMWEMFEDDEHPIYFSKLSETEDQLNFSWSDAKVRAWSKANIRKL